MNTIRQTPENITALEPNEIFVFGSNVDGIHGAGAARDAREKFGAQYGIAEGLTGQCYAIPTVDFKLKRYGKRYPLSKVGDSILRFIAYCRSHEELTFLLTPIGCGLAGFTEHEIVGIFSEHISEIPENIIFPKSFLDIILSEK